MYMYETLKTIAIGAAFILGLASFYFVVGSDVVMFLLTVFTVLAWGAIISWGVGHVLRQMWKYNLRDKWIGFKNKQFPQL